MLSPELDYLLLKEMHEERHRKMARQEMLNIAKGGNYNPQKLQHKAAGWLGGQMLKLGAKLQAYEAKTSPASRMVAKMR